MRMTATANNNTNDNNDDTNVNRDWQQKYFNQKNSLEPSDQVS